MSNDPKDTSVDLSKLSKKEISNQTQTHQSSKSLITNCNEDLKMISHELFTCIEEISVAPDKDKQSDDEK